ncbi:MAG: hypothetical protein N4A61_05570 [Pelagimonas sp.]|jgi:hypothetical protein|nr:hypothetical protein [Pelagimonas sp.]
MRWLVFWVLALPACAEDTRALGQVDYQQLFKDHSQQVQIATPGQRILELPGPVIVTEFAGNPPRYKAQDQSGHGAAMCHYAIMLDSVVVARLCPFLLPPQDAARLEGVLSELAEFVGANSYPALTAAQSQTVLDADLARVTQSYADHTCPDAEQDDAISTVIRNLAKPHIIRRLKRAIRRPRLAVSHPCL